MPLGFYMDTKKRKIPVRKAGQGLVEFALTIPVVLVIVLGMIEAGRLLFIYSSVVTASREAARYGTAIGDNGSGTPRYLDCGGIADKALAIGRFAGVDADTIVVQYDTAILGVVECASLTNPNDIRFGDRISISVTATYTPLATAFFDLPSFPINSIAKRSIIKSATIID